MGYWPPYVPVAVRRQRAERKMRKLAAAGRQIQPVRIEGRTIARSFWGKGWCDHLESFSDYENRLPRGRSYVRNGSVCHLEIKSGLIEAMVSGTRLYNVRIEIDKLPGSQWKTIRGKCAGQIGSVLELLRGEFSKQVMTIVTDRKHGLFPRPGEIKLNCSCPDWAVMCKHVSAVLYGVGNRLDEEPGLLFLLRGVDPEELITTEFSLPSSEVETDQKLAAEDLSGIFGIDIETEPPKPEISAVPVGRQRDKRPAKRPPSGRNGKKATASTALPNIRPTGRSVTRLRKKLKLTVPQFARLLGVAPPTVHRWEATSGRLKLQTRTLQALREASK